MLDQQFSLATRIVLEGRSVEVVGRRGSGRTHFLDRVAEYFLNRTWTVVRVRGNPEFVAIPMGALAELVESGRGTRTGALSGALEILAARLDGNACVVVDDWDFVDEMSRGIIREAARQTGSQIIYSRLLRPDTDEVGEGIEFSFSIELGPLRFGELERAIRTRLGNSIEQSTMSRIYAKSAGYIGIANIQVDAAILDKRMQLIRDRWVAVRNLWSPSLNTSVRQILNGLTDVELDALSILALVGLIDMSAASAVISAETLGRLEERGLIALSVSGGREYVTPMPPMIADYLRENAPKSRINRLQSALSERLLINVYPSGGEGITGDGQTAAYLRLVQEKHRIARAIAYEAFSQASDPHLGVVWIETIVASDGSTKEIDQAITSVENAERTLESNFSLALLKAENLAYGHSDLDAAMRVLNEAQPVTPEHQAQLALKVAMLSLMCGPCPELSSIPDPKDDSLSDELRAKAARLRAAVLTARGHFSESQLLLEAAEEYRERNDSFALLVSAMNSLAMGEIDRVIEIGRRGFDEARVEMNVKDVRRYAYVYILALFTRGTYTEADPVLDFIVSLGEPESRPSHEYLGVLVVGAIMSERRFFRSSAADFRRNIEAIRLPHGPYPGMGRVWAMLHGTTAGPDALLVATEMRHSSEAFALRKLDWIARWGNLIVVELSRSREYLAEVKTAERTDFGSALAAYEMYVEGLVETSADLLIGSGVKLTENGRYGMAVMALSEAERLMSETGEEQLIANATAQLRASIPPGIYDQTRFLEGTNELSDREAEIGVLAARGLTNQQIADDLMLSVRTVESHLNRAMKKLEVTRRSLLAQYLLPMEKKE